MYGVHYIHSFYCTLSSVGSQCIMQLLKCCSHVMLFLYGLALHCEYKNVGYNRHERMQQSVTNRRQHNADYVTIACEQRLGLNWNKKAELPQRWPRDAPYGCPEDFQESPSTPTATFLEIFNGLLFRSITWMRVQNSKFVALSIAETIRGTPKIGRLEILENNCTDKERNTFALRSPKAIHLLPGKHGEIWVRL